MIAIRNIRLIDGTRRAPEENVSILIRDGKFAMIGRSVPIPDNITVIEGNGLTALPGLIDMHTHMGGSSSFDYPPCRTRHDTYDYAHAREGFLRWGVTTVRSCGDHTADIIAFRDAVRAGRIRSPRIVCCGPYIQHPDGHPWGTVYSRAEEIRGSAFVFVDTDAPIEKQVDRIAAMGVDFIKVFYAHADAVRYPEPAPRMTAEQLKRVIDSAHRNGLKCACHVDGPDEMLAAAEAGADTVEHMVNVGNAEEAVYTDEMISRVKACGTVIDPTLIATYRLQDPGVRDACAPSRQGVQMLYAAGVPLAVGCDSGIPFVPFGESLHDEMACLAEAGIPNAEVLRMATIGNAGALGLGDQIGSIEAGKDADLLLVCGDPMRDLSASKQVRLVMMQGRIVYDAM